MPSAFTYPLLLSTALFLSLTSLASYSILSEFLDSRMPVSRTRRPYISPDSRVGDDGARPTIMPARGCLFIEKGTRAKREMSQQNQIPAATFVNRRTPRRNPNDQGETQIWLAETSVKSLALHHHPHTTPRKAVKAQDN